LLATCGGQGSGPTSAQMPSGRGQLITSPPTKLSSFSVSDLLSKLSGSDLGQELLKLAFSPTCSVDVYQLQYDTVGAQGESTTASGALMIPGGADPRCESPRPILLYAHGTSTLKTYNIADLTSNGAGLQVAGTGVTASGPMSGPYAVAAFADAAFEGQVSGSAVVSVTLLATSYQHAYRNLYSSPTEVFEAKYAAGIDALLPSTTDVSTLV